MPKILDAPKKSVVVRLHESRYEEFIRYLKKFRMTFSDFVDEIMQVSLEAIKGDGKINLEINQPLKKRK